MGSRRRVKLSMGTGTEPLCVQYNTETATVYLSGQDGCWQQLDTTCSLIIVHPSGTIWTVMDLQGHKMLPVKADLAIFSPVIGVSGSARVWLSCQDITDFSSCRIMPGFNKSI